MYNMINKKSRRFYFALLTMCMLWGGASNTSAQEIGVNANITGKVIDQYGNPVSDVTITMKNSDYKVVTVLMEFLNFNTERQMFYACHIQVFFIKR